MNSGPYQLFDDANFNTIFTTCVKLIGAVNLFEEKAKIDSVPFDNQLLIQIRLISHSCLNLFDELNTALGSGEEIKSKEWSPMFNGIKHLFITFLDMKPSVLDKEFKENDIPELIHALEAFEATLQLMYSQSPDANQVESAMKNGEVVSLLSRYLSSSEDIRHLLPKPDLVPVISQFLKLRDSCRNLLVPNKQDDSNELKETRKPK